MNRNYIITCASLLAAAAMTHSCNTAGCTDNQNSIPLAGFYLASTGEAVAVDSLEVWGVGAPGDSALYSPGDPLSQIYLPLRSTAASTSFCFHYTMKLLSDPAFNDTITLTYTSTPYFASEECGAMYRYTITGLTHTSHLISSVEVTDSIITNTDRQRLKIYFR